MNYPQKSWFSSTNARSLSTINFIEFEKEGQSPKDTRNIQHLALPIDVKFV